MLHVLDRHAVGQILRTKEVDAWGVATNVPRLPQAPDYPTAISILMRLDPLVVRGLRHGPTQDYQQEYRRVNVALDDAAETLVDVLKVHGNSAERVAATMETTNGDRPFPHKTAATQAGLGWIGKTALFVSPNSGPPSAWGPSSPIWTCPPESPSWRATAAAAAPASTRVPPAADVTCCGGRAWRASCSSTPAPAAIT